MPIVPQLPAEAADGNANAMMAITAAAIVMIVFDDLFITLGTMESVEPDMPGRCQQPRPRASLPGGSGWVSRGTLRR